MDDLDIRFYESILELFGEPIVELKGDDATSPCGQLGCEDACAGAYLYDGIDVRNFKRVGDLADDALVLQEVLPE